MPVVDAILQKAGIHVDDLNKLRLLQPEAWENTSALNQESKDFLVTVDNYNKAVDTVIRSFEELAALVEAEKLRAITLKNDLKMGKDKSSSESQQVQVLIRQRQVELERLRSELAAAQRMEIEQREFIQKFMNS